MKNTPPAPAHPLTPCLSFLSDYLRKTDRNGAAIFQDYMDNAKTPADIMDLLIDALRTRFHDPDVVSSPLDDREKAFAVIEHSACFGEVAFAGEFMRLAPYVLHNVNPSA